MKSFQYFLFFSILSLVSAYRTFYNMVYAARGKLSIDIFRDFATVFVFAVLADSPAVDFELFISVKADRGLAGGLSCV